MTKMKKSTPAATVLEGEWLTLAETVQTLNKSQSTVERLVGSGALKSKLVKRDGRKPERLYAAEDVKRLSNGDGTHANSRSVSLVKAPAETRLAIQPDAISALRDVMTEWRNAPPPRPWITVEEAAELSGMTPTFIRDRAHVGEIASARCGPHGALRVNRQSVLEFKGL
jgi:hypothetical protein